MSRDELVREIGSWTKKIAGYIPYADMVSIEVKGTLLKGLRLYIKTVKGDEVVNIPVCGLGTGLSREEFIGKLIELSKNVGINVVSEI